MGFDFDAFDGVLIWIKVTMSSISLWVWRWVSLPTRWIRTLLKWLPKLVRMRPKWRLRPMFRVIGSIPRGWVSIFERRRGPILGMEWGRIH